MEQTPVSMNSYPLTIALHNSLFHLKIHFLVLGGTYLLYSAILGEGLYFLAKRIVLFPFGIILKPDCTY
jgi:hypothetical protein